MGLLLVVKFLDKTFHLHARLVVLLYQRVVLQIYLLPFILVEVRVQLVELAGEQQLVVGYGQTVGAGLRLVHRRGGARIVHDEDHNQDYQSR